MKLGKAAAGAASILTAAALGLLSAGPASAASAGTRAGFTIERLPAHALATLEVPSSETSTCLAALLSPTFRAATRLDWCAAFATVLIVTVDDEVVGTATIDQDDYASWKVSSRTWNPTIQTFSEVDATGELEDQPLAVDGLSTCTSGCHVTSNGNYVLIVPVGPAVAHRDVGVDSPGKATVTGQLTTEWLYSALGLAFLPEIRMTTVGVRCDSQTGYKYPAGCANPSFTPTYVLSSADYPNIAKFDKAQLVKHPSWSTLTRVSPTQASANRRVACKGFHRRSPADSCDEFPYATTSQGGKGAVQEHVNVTENKAQGGNLGGFYNANRLHYGEKFHIKVT
jgi:hypothetical protein